ncbi:MAG: bifunctional [glutamate--ammonia ligase]-adenylyl-L-tyrosine phosphorylase/[glutamate--ammonia-ligase] adenylyltransferase [Planctomycetaceae bacterium]|nr:bifunctional [glutamate--ammonia ligase]-adenylyl-L-tyrosine phosphorylase/[glutamate--ammonia-ligase] adenylyltransferase [Planctomycetaceae bacterium]
MQLDLLRSYLDDFKQAEAWLRSLKLENPKRAHGNLVRMATGGITLDLLAAICGQLQVRLPLCADPDMALNNLDRFVSAARNPLSLGALFERDPESLATLLQILSTSQHLADYLAADPEAYDLLRLTEGEAVARDRLVDDLVSEVEALDHERSVLRALRRFKRRETLRIAYGDIIREQPLRTVTTQISFLADAILEAALRAAWQKTADRRGTPQGVNGEPARFVVLALGKLGGTELNYSSDIDLMFLYDVDGRTVGKRTFSNQEFFEQLARELVRMLTDASEMGAAYRVDLRLRPEGDHGPACISVENALRYYDLRGRTWERQAFIKARPVAGDLALGQEFLGRMRPWIYRRYLSTADINGIRALKRRIERRAQCEGAGARDLKCGHGGIRDIEFVIQFLQLLNGADAPKIRTGNTLEAISRLTEMGCLTDQEGSLLAENYAFLRKIEHRLQIMFDLQTHMAPTDPDEVRKLALRTGYVDHQSRPARDAFEADYADCTQVNRRILDHLLHDAFGDDAETAAEVDLVLDPDPPAERITEVLGKYPFIDIPQAYRNLMALAEEKIRFLSTRRCRHFLAAIAPELLAAIATTPDPDSTLVNLDKVGDSLGGKAVLWELFSFNPPSLHLYVRLCAYAPYLCGILTSNPGMIDGLMDSLVLDRLPTRPSLREMIASLTHRAEDIDPILHSFKNDQQLRVGVRDVLGKEDISAITGTLSDIAEVCLEQIAAREYEKLATKFGRPTVESGERQGEICEMAILAMGKFGGREMNYHSDLDIVFLYEAEGQTKHSEYGGRKETTTNQHFFGELGQRIIKTTSHLSAYGRLYEVDARLRPTGRSGILATSLAEFSRYFAEGNGQLWERQALCKGRVVCASEQMEAKTAAAVARAAFDHPWSAADAEGIRQMRRRMQGTAEGANLKRGPGGIVDIEFLVQMLQLKHGRRLETVRTPNTLRALRALRKAGLLADDDARFLTDSYRFLRILEGRLRLMNLTDQNKLPDDPTELTKLSHLLRWPSGGALLVDFERYLAETRKCFDRLFDAEAR